MNVEKLKMLCRLGRDVEVFASFNAFEHASTQVTPTEKNLHAPDERRTSALYGSDVAW